MLLRGQIFTTILLVLQSSHFKLLLSSSITKLSPCACEYNGHIYNLSSLAKKDGARFIKQAGGYKYGFNPCIPFTRGDATDCTNVAICYWSGDGQLYEGIGFQDDVHCQVNKEIVELIFNQRGTRIGMKSTVQFKCNQSKILTSDAEMNIVEDKSEPILEVEHKCCCPDGCPRNVPPTVPQSTVSPSTVFPTSTSTPTGVYLSGNSSIEVVWIAVAAAIVFIVIFLISVGFCCIKRPATGYPGIVRAHRPLRHARPREEEILPHYGTNRRDLLIPPPPPLPDYDDDERREGEEHEEVQPGVRDPLPFGVPEDGFTSPVQVTEPKPLRKDNSTK